MRAGRCDMTIPIGEDWAKDFTWYNDRKQTAPRSFAGWTAEVVIGTRVVPVTINANVMSIAFADTETNTVPDYRQEDWRLKLTDPEGRKTTWLKGQVTWRIQ